MLNQKTPELVKAFETIVAFVGNIDAQKDASREIFAYEHRADALWRNAVIAAIRNGATPHAAAQQAAELLKYWEKRQLEKALGHDLGPGATPSDEDAVDATIDNPLGRIADALDLLVLHHRR